MDVMPEAIEIMLDFEDYMAQCNLMKAREYQK